MNELKSIFMNRIQIIEEKKESIIYIEKYNDGVENIRSDNINDFIEQLTSINIKNIPVISKSKNGLLKFNFKSGLCSITEDNNSDNSDFDVSITIPTNSRIVHIHNKNCYIVSYNDNNKNDLVVFYDSTVGAVCSIDMNKLEGIILYPEIKEATKFVFKKFDDGLYRITEVVYDIHNETETKEIIAYTNLICNEVIDMPNKRIQFTTPICQTTRGVFICPFGKKLSVTETYGDSETIKGYSKEIRYNY